MEFKHYVGIDVSKNTLDFAILTNVKELPLRIQTLMMLKDLRN
jgi:hypothetical protein